MAPDEININKDTVIVHLIKKILELSESQQYTLLKQLEDPLFFSKEYGERNEARKSYINTIEFETKGNKCKGISQDISSGGMFIKTNEQVAVGNTIILNIPYTDNQKFIRVPAEIVRKDSNGIGVEFLKKTD
ncbi:MAG: PilZ domain-containing protein [Desulfobacteraceae bacterium]|nr:MAG: PilZ domain-containing protein [Desulfobacteraceae bacterium]